MDFIVSFLNFLIDFKSVMWKGGNIDVEKSSKRYKDKKRRKMFIFLKLK